MMSLAGAPMNIEISAFDVGSENIVHPLTNQVTGSGLANAIKQADVITAEFEHIPHDVLDECEKSGKFFPTTDAIKAGGDRRIEKSLLDNAGVKNAKYFVINTKSDFEQAIEHVCIPMVLKARLAVTTAKDNGA
jgi:5-(carboxyamino)imidazole ribonucleotide synthase